MPKLRLLLVDDDAMNLLLVSRYLATVPDWEIATCTGGQDALARLQRGERFDVLLVDWMMPGMSGYELLCKVRANVQYNGVRIMMLTAKEDLEDVTKALAAGAGEYLMKPFTKDMLVGKIQLLFSPVTAMAKIRVLIVDDSVVIRKLVSDCLASDPDIEVVGTAPNGQVGLAKIPQVNPDVVTLDIEMPVMDGLQALAAIRQTYRKLPVIMFSTLTERGATSTLDALSLGASDYVTKPSNVGQVSVAMQRIRDDLIPKIKGLCWRPAPLSVRPVIRCPALPAGTTEKSPAVLAIGVSTGGPNALAALFAGLPKDFPVPIVIVQHMPPLFTRLLAERLATVSGMTVREGVAGAVLRAGEVWVAPGGFHMDLERAADGIRLRLHQEPPENSCRPAVDVLFRSVAQVFGPRSLAVVLTGMGQDGLRGCQNIREAGGQVVVQDEATSVVWGMPGAVSQAGLADKILPLQDLAAEIAVRVGAGRRAHTLFPLASMVKAI